MRPLSRNEQDAIRYLSVDLWPADIRDSIHRAQAESATRRAAEVVAHTHSWDPMCCRCSRCGTTEEAHEAAKATDHLGAYCVPELAARAGGSR